MNIKINPEDMTDGQKKAFAEAFADLVGPVVCEGEYTCSTGRAFGYNWTSKNDVGPGVWTLEPRSECDPPNDEEYDEVRNATRPEFERVMRQKGDA
jgi:hypothetical protein